MYNSISTIIAEHELRMHFHSDTHIPRGCLIECVPETYGVRQDAQENKYSALEDFL